MNVRKRSDLKSLLRKDFLRKHWRSLAIVGAGLFVILMAHLLIVGPIIAENHEIERMVEKQGELIDKYVAKINEAQNRSGDLEKLRERSRLARYLSEGESPTQTAAKLDALFSSLESRGMKKISFQPLDQSKDGGILEANMKCALTGDIRGLYHLFLALDEYPQPIKVKECIIRALSNRSNKLDPINVVIVISTIIGIDKEG